MKIRKTIYIDYDKNYHLNADSFFNGEEIVPLDYADEVLYVSDIKPWAVDRAFSVTSTLSLAMALAEDCIENDFEYCEFTVSMAKSMEDAIRKTGEMVHQKILIQIKKEEE